MLSFDWEKLEKGIEESLDYASLRDGMVSVGCKVVCIGHPFPLEFGCFEGRTTRTCKFDPAQLRDIERRANYYHCTYLNVRDVRDDIIRDKENQLYFPNLSVSEDRPLLTVQGFFCMEGMTGSPLFDPTGLVIGLVWFGDQTFVYGIPTPTISHGISIQIPHVVEFVDIKQGDSGARNQEQKHKKRKEEE